MSAGKGKTSEELSKHLVFQRRLANYLRSYRLKNKLSSKEMSKRLGYAHSRYSRLESENIPYDRFINTIEFLKMLADVKKISLSDFILYLSGSEGKIESSYSKTNSKVISLFENISSKTMRTFLQVASTETKKEKEELEMIIDLYIKIKTGLLQKEVVDAICMVIKELSKQEGKK